ncbi:MAG: hypothetical protein ABI432_13050 [Flavobacteriales bacterium]
MSSHPQGVDDVMRKDIHPPKVEGIAMAVVREADEEGEEAWYVYLINQRDVTLENVLVSSRGYGELGGETRKTSEMRHFLGQLGPKSWARIERIVEDVFPLNNQYWLSYYVGHDLHDKKYIFLPESIQEENFTMLPLMNKRGVMIQ